MRSSHRCNIARAFWNRAVYQCRAFLSVGAEWKAGLAAALLRLDPIRPRAGLTGTVPSRFPQALRLRYGQGIARMAGWGWPRFARDYPVFDSAYDQLFNSHDVTHGEPFPCGLCGFLSGPTVEVVYEYRQAADQAMVTLIEGVDADAGPRLPPSSSTPAASTSATACRSRHVTRLHAS